MLPLTNGPPWAPPLSFHPPGPAPTSLDTTKTQSLHPVSPTPWVIIKPYLPIFLSVWLFLLPFSHLRSGPSSTESPESLHRCIPLHGQCAPRDQRCISRGKKYVGFIHRIISCIISELLPDKPKHLPQRTALGGVSPRAPSRAALTFQVAVFLRK